MPSGKIIVAGAAGLVGQNLVPRLKARNLGQLVAIDKHVKNTETLRGLHPDVRVIHADLADSGAWQSELEGGTHLVIGHAQIGGTHRSEYVRNNIVATERLLEAALRYRVPYVVSISSSVVNSNAVDDYTETKKAQEALVAKSGISQVVLRPTLMFGWFDRKHVGWLARFMKRVPIFPIPGNGRFLRQPLYAGDFCQIIMACLDRRLSGTAYNITGLERIDFIDLMRSVREAVNARTPIVRVPYGLFWLMLKAYALADRNPPFTTGQLRALVTPDIFEVVDWPGMFGVSATPLTEALHETFRDPRYSSISLEF